MSQPRTGDHLTERLDGTSNSDEGMYSVMAVLLLVYVFWNDYIYFSHMHYCRLLS